MVNKTVFEKLMNFCIENNIPAEISNLYKNAGKCIQIWECGNVYYQILEHNIGKRCRITEEAFDCEWEDSNGKLHYDFSKRISYDYLIELLKEKFLRGK